MSNKQFVKRPSGLLVAKDPLPQTEWLLRVRCNDGVELDDASPFTGTFHEAQTRMYTLAHRTSYQVNGKHREVLWDMCRMSKRPPRKWTSVLQGKSRCRPGARPM